MDDLKQAKSMNYCIAALSRTAGAFGRFFALTNSPEQIRKFYNVVAIQTDYSRGKSSVLQEACRRKALFYLRLAEAQNFFYWLKSGKQVFNTEDFQHLRVNGQSLISLDTYVLNFWEN